MDGLPKNKKPWKRPDERDNVGLDSYLFERKLQEVYDVKTASDDTPKPVKALKKLFKKKPKQPKVAQATKPAKVKKRKKVQLIDAPYIAPKRPVTPAVPVKKQRKNVHVHVTVPKVSFKKPSSKTVVGLSTVFLVAVAVIGAAPNKQNKGVLGEVTDIKPIAQKPDFTVLTPVANQPAIQSKVKFDASKKVASYVDTLEGANLVINQQKLGETELKDTEFLRRTSIGFNLNKEVTTKKGQAFIGENKEKNTQFAFFIYNGFLFLLQSDKTLKFQSVVDYIDSLQ